MTTPTAPDPAPRHLCLYVSGASDLSARAITNARHLCDHELVGQYTLSVVDIHDDPAAALRDSVLATPTLVRSTPPPVRRFVGDLSRTERVVLALDLARPGQPRPSAVR